MKLNLLLVLLISCLGLRCKQPEFKPETQFNITLDSSTLGIQVISTHNKVPWELLWGPDHTLWYSEQEGNIYKINLHNGKRQLLLRISDVAHKNTAGLLGMAMSASNTERKESFLFAAYTFKIKDSIGLKLVRYLVKKDTLIEPKVICAISGFNGHFGSRLAVSPDHKVYWATGDGQQHNSSQNTADLKGKVLRFNLDGSVPSDNPIAGNPVWAWGFRNIQGLTFKDNDHLYTSEHGDASDDEVNQIRRGGNFGWPAVEGFHNLEKEKTFVRENRAYAPLIAWTPTIAPSGMAFYNSDRITEWKNSLLLVSLKDRSLRVLTLSAGGDTIVKEKIYLDKIYGRLRAVCVSPEGDIYLSTSNRDWNPYSMPQSDDDKIIRITKVKKVTSPVIPEKAPAKKVTMENAASLYTIYCASCHKQDGAGSKGVFPSLRESPLLNDRQRLIDLFLFGKSTEGSQYQMPAFKFLNNEEAAALLNFIRTSWGNNNKDSISESNVDERRVKKTK